MKPIESKYEYTEHALNHVAHCRRVGGPVSWFDVLAAYDAGLAHAVSVTPAKRQALIRYLKALRVINAARTGANK